VKANDELVSKCNMCIDSSLSRQITWNW